MSSNVVILGKAGTNETYIPFSLNDGGVLYTDQAPNSNAGIIQGRDLEQGGVDFGVVLDGMGTNLNALPTVSRMYATNPITGAITPVGINTAGELIVSGGGGGGGGVVQGIDTTSEEAVNISATNAGLNVNLLGVDTVGSGSLVGLATTIINETLNTAVYAYDVVLNQNVQLTAQADALTDINKLYTRSNLYVNQEGALTPTELPLNCDDDGYLNVHIQAGGAGGGGIVQGKNIATDLGVDINAEVNAISGINSLYTHSSIYGKDPISELEKQVEVNTEGQVSVLVKNDSLLVNVSDGAGLPLSSTSQAVGTGTANFLNTYSRMVGTSNGTDYKLALMDSAGRLTTLSNIRDSNGNSVGSQVQSGGTQRGLNVLDINQTYTTGNLNVNVANTATTNSNTRDGAGTLITSTLVGVKQGLDVNIIAGGGGGGGGGVVQLQAYDSADGTTPMNVEATANRLLTDTNIVDAVNPLRKLVVNEDGSINVAGGGGGGGGVVQGIDTTSNLPVDIGATDTRLLTNSLLVNSTGLVLTTTTTGGKESLDVSVISNSSIVQGLDTGTGANVDIKATDNRLLTNSLMIGKTGADVEQHLLVNATGSLIVEAKTHDGTNNPINSTVVGTDRALDVYVLGNNPILKGTYNNIHSGSLTTLANSTALNINNEYGNESVISYEDTTVASTGFISIYGSFDNTTFFYIGVLQPVLVRSTLRQASAVLKLKGLKYIRIANENATTVSGIKCSLFSGE
jgi:hypothetical protein